MVRREACPNCKGNKYVQVMTPSGRAKHTRCPQCGGNGYRVRLISNER